MSKYNRYLFTRRLYKDYVIFIKNKELLITYGKDLEIYKLFKDNLFNLEINYLILDNVNIIKKVEYKNNKYRYYYKIIMLINIVDYIYKSDV